MPVAALLALLALAQVSTVPSGRPAEASGDRLIAQPSAKRFELHGHARLRSGGLTLRADEIDFNQQAQRAHVTGEVIFSEGLLGGTALSLDVDLRAESGSFRGATLYAKTATTPAQLAEARTPEAMRLVGRNALTLRAEEVQRLAPEHFVAEEVWITPCDCRVPDWRTEPPSWSVRALRADLEVGKRLRLTWARLYIKDVPTLPVPILFLPLSNRQTGFLLPRPNFTAKNGVQLEQPFFWAINRWADATVTPGYFFGLTHADGTGMRGPRLATELRYIPSIGTHGRLTLAGVYDLKGVPGTSDTRRGLRGELGLEHVQALGAGFEDRADVQLLSDQRYFGDITSDVVAAQATYLRSDARIDHRSANTLAYLTASTYQTLTPVPELANGLNPFFGPHNVDQLTFQRLPALGFDVAEAPLGPLRMSLESSAVRQAPLGSRAPLSCGLTPGDPCAFLSSRQVTERLGAAPELRLPLRLGRFAELAPFAQLRGDVWQAGATQTSRAFPVLGATARTELARIYERGGVRWRHVISPAVELVSVPTVWGQGPEVPNDERDAPVSSGLLQGVAVLRTRLDRREGERVSEPLRAEVGQGFDLRERRRADTFADATLQLGALAAHAGIHYDLPRRTLAALSARVGYTFARGSALSASYQQLDPAGTDAMRAGLFELVGPMATLPPTTGARAELLGVSGRYKPTDALTLDGSISFLPTYRQLFGYSVGIGYGSPCNCWGFQVNANFLPTTSEPSRRYLPASFTFVFNAQRLGGVFGD